MQSATDLGANGTFKARLARRLESASIGCKSSHAKHLSVGVGADGDSLVLHYGTREQPRLGLIDGGPGGASVVF